MKHKKTLPNAFWHFITLTCERIHWNIHYIIKYGRHAAKKCFCLQSLQNPYVEILREIPRQNNNSRFIFILCHSFWPKRSESIASTSAWVKADCTLFSETKIKISSVAVSLVHKDVYGFSWKYFAKVYHIIYVGCVFCLQFTHIQRDVRAALAFFRVKCCMLLRFLSPWSHLKNNILLDLTTFCPLLTVYWLLFFEPFLGFKVHLLFKVLCRPFNQ